VHFVDLLNVLCDAVCFDNVLRQLTESTVRRGLQEELEAAKAELQEMKDELKSALQHATQYELLYCRCTGLID
jgi:uncharacterized membrane-anchored protein YhcB (DUF1043 family)